VLGGTAAKPDRTFTVVLSSPSAMTIAKGTGTGSIIGHKVDQSGATPTTPPAPTPPATPPPATPPVTAQQQQQNELPVKVTGKTKTLAPNVVAVELSCPRATVICAGSFELQVKGKRIGRATFFVKPAETRFISVRLFSAPAAIFQKAGKLAPLMKGTMRDGKDFSANPKFTALKKK
jgi:hypothetical protein